MLMPRRSFSAASAYKFGFNGKENDNEVKGLGNQQDYGMRIYDPRIGKFLSVDPLTKNFPWYTPYQFAGNIPIAKIDLDGSEPRDFRDNWVPKSLFVLSTKQLVGGHMLITDPKLGKDIDVEMVYDNWTKQVWFVHQDDQGNWLYLKNDNGVHTEMSIDPKTNTLRGGAFVPFETQDQLQGKYMRELADGTGTAMAVIIATIAGGIAIDGALSTYGTKAVGDFVINEIKDELVDQAKESLGIPDFNPRDLKDAVDGAKNIVKKKHLNANDAEGDFILYDVFEFPGKKGEHLKVGKANAEDIMPTNNKVRRMHNSERESRKKGYPNATATVREKLGRTTTAKAKSLEAKAVSAERSSGKKMPLNKEKDKRYNKG
jgi:RHS repeat-associated protein